MQSLIKRNNFSPEDRKILNKIDRHIKELEEKVEQGGGGGNNTAPSTSNEHDIHLETDNKYIIGYYIDGVYPNMHPEFSLDDFNKSSDFDLAVELNEKYEEGDRINIYLNNTFIYSFIIRKISYGGMDMLMSFEQALDYDSFIEKFYGGGYVGSMDGSYNFTNSGFSFASTYDFVNIVNPIQYMSMDYGGQQMSVIQLTTPLYLEATTGSTPGNRNLYNIIKKINKKNLLIYSQLFYEKHSTGGSFRSDYRNCKITAINENLIEISITYEDRLVDYFLYLKYSLSPEGYSYEFERKEYYINKTFYDNLEARLSAIEQALNIAQNEATE